MDYLSTLSAAQTTGRYHPDLLSNDILQAAMLRRPSIYWTSVVCCVYVRLTCSITSLVLAPSGVKGYHHTATKTTSVDLFLTQILIDYDLISVRFIVFF